MKSSSPQQAARGFTLIELMIVLVIMSFVLALAGPAVTRGLSGLTLKTAAKKVAAALRYARSQAVNRAQPYSAIFDREHGRIVIRGIPRPLPPDQTAAEAEPEEKTADAAGAEAQKPEIKIVALPEGITLKEITIGGTEITGTKDELAQIVFYPDGTSQGGELVLVDSRERQYQVNVAFLTGVVTIEEPEA
jgi:general secretion pathway protein H